jgi:hypothetical protein
LLAHETAAAVAVAMVAMVDSSSHNSNSITDY